MEKGAIDWKSQDSCFSPLRPAFSTPSSVLGIRQVPLQQQARSSNVGDNLSVTFSYRQIWAVSTDLEFGTEHSFEDGRGGGDEY